MPRKSLTPGFVAKAIAEPDNERTVYWDENLRCFGLMVTAKGHKSYVVQYRNRAGDSCRVTLNGTMSLDQARKEARAIIGDVARGGDPLAERRKERNAGADTFRAIATDYLAREGKKLRSANQWRAVLDRLVFDQLGKRPIEEIKRTHIVRLLDKIEDERGPSMADMTLAVVRRVFSWHASRSDDFRSPVAGGGMSRDDVKAKARKRILTDAELQVVWRAADSYPGSDSPPGPWGRYVQFLLLTACRRNEASDMEWSELSSGEWVIPAERYKTKTEVTLPLSKQAQAILASIPRIDASPYVFTITGKRPIGGFSAFKRQFDKTSGVTNWRLHDLRRTARSLMSRAGITPDVAERCLGHVIPGVRATYDRHKYLEEMLHAFEALASQVERIVNPQQNVLTMTRK